MMNPADKLIAMAILAPSSHNTQPWRFRASGNDVDVFADPPRALPVTDPDGREMLISCGCAVFNLRVAGAAEGSATNVTVLPDPQVPTWLARVHLTEATPTDTSLAELARCIEHRHTYRNEFEDIPVDRREIRELVDAASTEGATLRVIESENVRHALADLVAQGDAVQWANPEWRRELAEWMHTRSDDGLVVPAVAGPIARFVVRTFNMGGGVGAEDRELANHAPLLAVLSTSSDSREDWLLAGQALERVLLTACRHGLQASYLNQPVQVASLRARLQELLGSGYPQMVMRLGFPPKRPDPSPRRPVEAVLNS